MSDELDDPFEGEFAPSASVKPYQFEPTVNDIEVVGNRRGSDSQAVGTADPIAAGESTR
jgi:hypothetical protein